ncbi:RluA family pseudouridine synthase [Nitritalea halalkaliphila]|nr:pseudouridine synthase [Nitritalea halalkaliphila]
MLDSTLMPTVIFEDEALLVLHKPAGLLVHPNGWAEEPLAETLVGWVQAYTQAPAYLAHRLDRATSGLILLGKNEQVARILMESFLRQEVQKKYVAVVRGWPAADVFRVERPLAKDLDGPLQDACTDFRVFSRSTCAFNSTGRYPSSRYSLLWAEPQTGRMHQIRRHLAMQRHYLIGDSKHGDNTQNNYLRQYQGITRMLLHAVELRLPHPEQAGQ